MLNKSNFTKMKCVISVLRFWVRMYLTACLWVTNPLVIMTVSAVAYLFIEEIFGFIFGIALSHVEDATQKMLELKSMVIHAQNALDILLRTKRVAILLLFAFGYFFRIAMRTIRDDYLEAFHNETLVTPEADERLFRNPMAEESKLQGAERMIPGSDLQANVVPPSYQVEIFVAKGKDTKLYYAGVGFKTKCRIVTAMHVVAEATEVMLRNPNTGSQVSIKPERFVETHVDVTWVPLSLREAGTLGLSAAKLTLNVPRMQWVQVTAQSKMTFGHLEEVEAMGMVQYSGSTIQGFSGAPYFVNKFVYGMHVGAGTKANFGFSASYIAALIRQYDTPNVDIPEDSADYLIGQLKKYRVKEFRYEHHPIDQDIITIRVGGSYHNITPDTYNRLIEEDYEANYTTGMVYDRENARTDQAFLGQRFPQQAPDIPLCPANLPEMIPKVEDLPSIPPGFAEFPENATASTSKQNGTSPPRMEDDRFARLDELIKQNEVLLESLSQMKNSGTDSPPLTRVRQRGPLVTTIPNSSMPATGMNVPTNANRKKKAKMMALKERVRHLEQVLNSRFPDQTLVRPEQSQMQPSVSRIGVATLQPHTISMPSSPSSF